MKTRVHSNSIASYQQMREAGEISRRQLEVLEALQKFGPMTREQIGLRTGMKEGSACGRVAELIEKGLVDRDGSTENETTTKPNEIVCLVERFAAPVQMKLLEAA